MHSRASGPFPRAIKIFRGAPLNEALALGVAEEALERSL